MKNIKKRAVVVAASMALGMSNPAWADLVAGWNFNDNDMVVDHGAGTLSWSGNSANIAYFAGSSINAVSPDVAGNAISPFNSADNTQHLDFTLSLTGFQSPILTYATRGTATGFSSQEWLYSLDGTNYTSFQTFTGTNVTTFSLKTVDFTTVPALTNLGTAYFRVTLDGATSGSGNNRFDNVLFNSAVFNAGAENLTWSPPGTTWNTTDTNWDNEVPTAVAFATNDNVFFTDSGLAGGSNVTVDAGGVSPNTINVQNTTGTYTIGGGSINAGAGGLIKTNAGTLILTGTNTFTGGTQINGGTVSISSDDNLGAASGGISFDGGTLLATGAVTGTRAVTINAGGATINTNGNNIAVGAVSGAGALVKSGAGDLAFSGAFGASGAPIPITLNAGSLSLAAGSATAQIAAGGAINGDLIIKGGAARRVNFTTGTFSGTGSVRVETSGHAISVDGSSAGLTPVLNLPIVLNSTVPANDPAGAFTTNIGVASGSGTANLLTLNGAVSGASNVVFSAVTGNAASGSGIVLLNAANTWTGSSQVNTAASGVVRLGVNNALPTGTALIFGNGSTNVGSLDLNGKSQTIASLASNTTGSINGIANTGTASTFTINGSADTTYAGSIGVPAVVTNLAGANDNIALALHTSNTGVTTLSGASTYSGGTTINGGTLRAANTSGSATGSGAVAVNNGGTLGGTGKISGALTIASGGTLAPGASVGTLSAGSLTLAGGSQLAFEVGGGGADSVTLTGAANNFTANGGAFTFTSTGTIDPGNYTLIDYAGAIGGGGFGALVNNTSTLADRDLALLNNSSNSSVDLAVTISGVAMKTWNGGSGVWESGGAANFQGPANFTNGEQARFDDSATGTTTVITSGTVSPAWMYFNNSTKNYNVSGGNISGGGGLSKSGSGTVTLSGDNSFSGPVNIRDGVVSVNTLAAAEVNSPLGSGTSIILGGAGGTLRYTGGTTSFSRTFDLQALQSGIDVSAGATDLTVSSALGGVGGLAKLGAGRLILSNTGNNYLGGTLVSSGELLNGGSDVIPDGSALTVATGATYSTGANAETVGSISGGGTINVGGAQVLTVGGDGTSTVFSGSINGAGDLTKTGAGTLSLSGTNGLAGILNVNNGFVGLNAGAAIGAVASVNLTTGGGLKAEGTVTTAATINIGTGGGTIDTNGNTMTVNAALPDGGTGNPTLTKIGAGTLHLAVPSSTRNDPTTINGGTIKISSVDSDKISGIGRGAITINNGGTLQIDNIAELGQVEGQPNPPPIETRPAIRLNHGATLLGTGTSLILTDALRVQFDAGTEVNIQHIGNPVTESFTLGSAVRNGATNPTGGLIKVSGGGRVILASGATSPSATGDQFSGSWEVQNAILQIGPAFGFGSPINALGYTPGGNNPQNGPTRPVTVKSGGTLLLAVASSTNVDAGSFRSPIFFDGGAIATTLSNAIFSGDLTTVSSSTVKTDDPVNGGGQTVLIGTQDVIEGFPQLIPVTNGNIAWGNATLDVTGTGTLRFERRVPVGLAQPEPASAVSVTAGATLRINNSAQVTLAGTQDALSSGSAHVNVINNSTATNGLYVESGNKNAGAISGTGNTRVEGGATLTASSIRQNALELGGSAKVRQNGTNAATSKLTNITFNGTQLDLTNNKLIVTGVVAGTYTGGQYTGVSKMVKDGMGTINLGSPTWNGTGIVTTESAAGGGNISTTLAVASAASVNKSTFGGVSVSGSDALVMYTYNGDANLSGNVDADDYFQIDKNYSSSGSVFGFNNGDFNYDGQIDGDDYALIDAGFSASQVGPAFPQAPAIEGVSAVPEPASISVLALAAAGMLRRRRRH